MLRSVIFSLALVVVGAFAQPAKAQELFLRNHPYKGKTAGYGKDMLASAKELATAMELPVQEAESALIIGTPPADTSSLKGVWVNGAVLPSRVLDGEQLVDVRAFAKAAGLRYEFSQSLGTIDLTLPAGGRGNVSAGTAPSSSDSGRPIDVKFGPLAHELDVDALAQPGKLTIILLYHDGYKDAGYRSLYTRVAGFARNEKVAVCRVNMGTADGPLCKKYPNMSYDVPHLLVYARPRRVISVQNGKSIDEAVGAPEKFVTKMLELSETAGGLPLSQW